MYREYAAQTVPASERAQFWQDTLSTEIFALNSAFRDADGFDGVLRTWDLGAVSLVRMRSRAARYRRTAAHVANDSGSTMLVSFSAHSDIDFSQDGIDLLCRKKQFFVERTDRPSDFHQTSDNEIWGLKLPMAYVEGHIRSVDPFYGTAFDADAGAGGLLFDMLQNISRRHDTIDASAAKGVGQTLIELLVLALETDARSPTSTHSCVQRGHLARVERFIRQNLKQTNLSPATVAEHCQISVRYLHLLYQGSGTSAAQRIRELRLEACRRQLEETRRRDSIAEIAYRWGFTDQAHFSRHFKARFGMTAGDMRAASRSIALRLT